MEEGKKPLVMKMFGRCKECPGPEGRIDRRLLWCLNCMMNERRETELASVYLFETRTWGEDEGKVVVGRE